MGVHNNSFMRICLLYLQPGTMAHSQCHGVDPVDMESEEIDPPYCPHGELEHFQLKWRGQA